MDTITIQIGKEISGPSETIPALMASLPSSIVYAHQFWVHLGPPFGHYRFRHTAFTAPCRNLQPHQGPFPKKITLVLPRVIYALFFL